MTAPCTWWRGNPLVREVLLEALQSGRLDGDDVVTWMRKVHTRFQNRSPDEMMRSGQRDVILTYLRGTR